MTNQQLVAEACRTIRGIALNYPDGMDQIRATVAALSPATAVAAPAQIEYIPARPAQTVTKGSTECPQTASTASWAATDTLTLPQPSPDSDQGSQRRRGPGRPRKIRTEEGQ